MGWKKLIGLCLLTAMGITGQVQAQPKCKIVHYSTEEGLSHDNLTCILKDHEGFMWFGSWDGINRYDGHNFINYKARVGDRSVLKNNRIDQIAEDRRGFLWLRVYDNQVYRFDKKHETFYAVTQSLKRGAEKYNFISIKPASTGDVWLLTEKDGIFCAANPDAQSPVFTAFQAGADREHRLPSNQINFWHESRNHQVWVGTQGGLCQLVKTSSGSFISKPLPLKEFAGVAFISLAEDEANLWFGTGNGYMVGYNKSTGKISVRKISAQAINGLCVSKKRDVIYASSAAGELITVQLSGGGQTAVNVGGKAPLFAVYEDTGGMLWIEPEVHGVIRFNPSTNVYKVYNQPNEANYLNGKGSYRVFEDNKGLIWINLKGGGFGYYNPQKDAVAYFYDGPDPLTHQFSNMVNALYYDPAGIMWISSDERGLTKVVFQPNDFNYQLLVKDSYNKSDNEVRGICADRNGRIWVATKAGKLYVKDAQGRVDEHVFINGDNRSLGQIYCIYQDHSGVMWLGTKSDGLYRATPVIGNEGKYTLQHYTHANNVPNSISSDEIYTILEDKAGRLWVGTFDNGLNLVERDGANISFLNIGHSFKNYPSNFKKIRHMGLDAYNRLWIGTTNGLLVMTAPEHGNQYSFSTYTKIPGDVQSLANNDIQYIYQDSRGRMWIATSGGGINVTDVGAKLGKLRFNNYSTANGLPNDYVLTCIEDNDHQLWMATQQGLTRFDPVHRRFTNYDSDDGLPQARFAEAACAKTVNNTFVFGTIRGYINFNPATVVNHLIPGQMAITNLQVNNRDIAVSADSLTDSNPNYIEELRLNHDQNILNINYAVLDYRSANKQRYQYRLKNFDQSWRDNKDQRTATYTNLPPGKYEFEVRCLNNDLYSNVPYKKLAIIINPPFWKTWWAYVCYAIILFVLLEIARRTTMTMLRLRHRIAVEQKLAELKMGFFTNVSHELRTPLTLILNPIEEIAASENLSDRTRQNVNVIRRNANRMVRFINQLLDLRKVQSGKVKLKISRIELVSFITRIVGYFTESVREKNISLQLEHDESQVFAWIDAEKIDIVIYNLIANAVKFSPVGKAITIRITADEQTQWLGIEVCDQGAGVPDDKLTDIFELYYEGDHPDGATMKGTGIGLALSKEFVELHHGKISARNLAGHGFAVKVALQQGKAHFNHEEAQMVDVPVIDRAVEEDEMITAPTVVAVSGDGLALPKLLLVEDNSELRLFLQQQLSPLYQVETAEHGADGLAKARQILPDLVISDVMMPKMDGIQMLDKLKNDAQTSHIPVVLLTARFSVEHQVEGLKYGADLYITKPFQNAYLLAAVANLLNQRRKLFETYTDKHKKVKLEPGELVITSKDEAFLKQIIEIVEKGMEDPEFSIDNVAESIGMGRTTFYTKFKSLTNLAPVEFVRDMRLKRGRQFLDAGETNIATVAYSVGFNNAKYFSTCFKEKYQMTPSEYLKTLKSK